MKFNKKLFFILAFLLAFVALSGILLRKYVIVGNATAGLTSEKINKFISINDYYPESDDWGFYSEDDYWGVEEISAKFFDINPNVDLLSIKGNTGVAVGIYYDKFEDHKCNWTVLAKKGFRLPKTNDDTISRMELSKTGFLNIIKWNDKSSSFVWNDSGSINVSFDKKDTAQLSDVIFLWHPDENCPYKFHECTDKSETDSITDIYYLRVYFDGYDGIYYSNPYCFFARNKNGIWVLISGSLTEENDTIIITELPESIQNALNVAVK